MMTNIWAFQAKISQLKEILEYVKTHLNNNDPMIVMAELENICGALDHIKEDEINRKHYAAVSINRIYLMAYNAIYRMLYSEGLWNEQLENLFDTEIKKIEKTEIKR